MYINDGWNVYAAVVERVLASHPDVAEAAVIGAPDDTWGEVGMAFLVPAAGAEVDESPVSVAIVTLTGNKSPALAREPGIPGTRRPPQPPHGIGEVDILSCMSLLEEFAQLDDGSLYHKGRLL